MRQYPYHIDVIYDWTQRLWRYRFIELRNPNRYNLFRYHAEWYSRYGKKGNTCTACLHNYSNNRQIGKRNLFHVSSTTRRKPTLQTQKYPWRTRKCHCRVLQGSTGRNLYWWCFLWMDKPQTGFRRDTESVLWQIRERLQKIFPLHFCFNYQKEI